MNTLTLIKKQIEKAAALHDAQIAMTHISWCYDSIPLEVHGTFAIVVTLAGSDAMEHYKQLLDRTPWLCRYRHDLWRTHTYKSVRRSWTK